MLLFPGAFLPAGCQYVTHLRGGEWSHGQLRSVWDSFPSSRSEPAFDLERRNG